MSRYRIIECKQGPTMTWFEIEKKGWFGWSTQTRTDYTVLFWPIEIPLKFAGYDDAKSYIDSKLIPVERKKTAPITRHVYETF